jgi:hypothetical protein
MTAIFSGSFFWQMLHVNRIARAMVAKAKEC